MPSIFGKRYNSPEKGDVYLRYLESRFPAWNSIELFGPPGAGKSHISLSLREVGVGLSALMSYEEIISPILSPWRNRIYKALPKKYTRKFYKRNYKKVINNDRNGALNRFQDYARMLKAHIVGADISNIEARILTDAANHALFAAFRAGVRGGRVIIDEGVLEILAGVLVRSRSRPGLEQFSRELRKLLNEYPAEKRGVLVDCDPGECMRRQAFRGKESATDERPQLLYHECVRIVYEACVKANWEMVVLDNGPKEWQAPDGLQKAR